MAWYSPMALLDPNAAFRALATSTAGPAKSLCVFFLGFGREVDPEGRDRLSFLSGVIGSWVIEFSVPPRGIRFIEELPRGGWGTGIGF